MGSASHSALTVRPPDRWQNHKLFFAVLLLAAVAALFQWGNIRFRQRHPVEYQAAAAVRLAHTTGAAKGVVPAETEALLDYSTCLANIARLLDQPETIRQVLSELADKDVGGLRAAAALVAVQDKVSAARISGQQRPSLRVRVEPSGQSHPQLYITCTSSDPVLALPVANALAARGADLFRQSCRAKLQAVVASAAEEFERSGVALSDAQEKMDRFLAVLSQGATNDGGYSGQGATDGGRSAAGAAGRTLPDVTVSEPKYRELVENPRWTELQLKLQHLEQQRAVLLVDRTEAHPAVRQIEAAIAEARRQLAETAQWQEAGLSAQAVPAPEAIEAEPKMSGSPRPVISEQQQSTLKALKESLADAQRRAAQAAAQYEQAVAAARIVPEVEVRWATGCSSIAPAVPLTRLLIMALSTGLAATIGVCLIGAGVTAENIVAIRTEVEARLPVPVVGVIPAESPGIDPRVFRVRQRLARWGKIFLGLFLAAGAVACFLAV